MTDDFCVFVILASLIGLALPSAAVMIYLGFASVLVCLAAMSGGIERGSSTPVSDDTAPVVRPGEVQ
jgi:hypothetical protein